MGWANETGVRADVWQETELSSIPDIVWCPQAFRAAKALPGMALEPSSTIRVTWNSPALQYPGSIAFLSACVELISWLAEERLGCPRDF